MDHVALRLKKLSRASGPAKSLAADIASLERHLDAFSAAGVDVEILDIYLGLAARSVKIMRRDGRDLAKLRERILIAKRLAE